MKKNTLIKSYNYLIILMAIAASLMLSCQKNSNENLSLNKKVRVHIGTVNPVIIAEELIKVKGGVSGGKKQVKNAIQRDTTQWDDNFLLVTELKPRTTHRTKSSTLPSNALENSSLAPGVVYRVYVYNEQGSLLTHRDYIRGQENNTEPLLLDAGSTYSFIAFSRNTNKFSDLISPEKMSNVELFAVSDHMLFRKQMKLAENSENYLNINFRHLFAELSLTVDASATGQKLTLIGCSFTGTYYSGFYNLLTGELLRYAKTALPLDTHQLNDFVHVSSFAGATTPQPIPYRLCIKPNTSLSFQANYYGIGSFRRINQLKRNYYFFQNLNVSPGIKYDCNILIVPKKV